MQDLNDKITGGTLSAAEWNEVPTEMQNIIIGLGQVLAGSDLNQLGKALAGYGMAASFMTETGIADAYIANPIGAKQGPASLSVDHDGMLVRFVPGNNNTGASTVDINGLGSRDVTREDGGAVQSGDLSTTREAWIRWDFAADDWKLLNFNIPGSLEVPRGYIDGYLLVNGTDADHDINFGIGIARDSTNVDTIQNSGVIVKEIDGTGGWVVGTTNAGRPAVLDPLAADTWYHCFVIKDPTLGLVDFGYDTSIVATNLLAEATGYTEFLRIGAVLTDGSANILGFTQVGDAFKWNVPVSQALVSNPGTGVVSHTILGSPLGIKVLADMSINFGRPDTSAATAYVISGGDETPTAPVLDTVQDVRTRGDGRWTAWVGHVLTSTAKIIKTQQSASNANALITMRCHGWQDPRGKDV